MNILHLIKSLGRGGAEMLLPETLKLHERNRYSFFYSYFLPWKNQVVPILTAQGVCVKCFEASNNLRMLLTISKIVNYVKQNNIELIHAHLPWAGFVAGVVGKIAGIPVIYTEHNNFNRYHWLTRFVSKYSYHNYRKVFMVSNDAFLAAKSHFRKGFPCNVDTLLNGVNTDFFRADIILRKEIRDQFGWTDEHVVIGLTSVYRKQKRIDRWLLIAKLLHKLYKNARFLLVGAGPLQTEVDQWISDHDLQDVIVQPGLQQDVKPFYSAMDIFHMSSDFEGLPIALLEAMSMGLVPVVTRTGGMPEVVDENCGFIYDKEDISCAVNQISDCINDPKILLKKKIAARNRVVDHFDLKLMVKQLEEAYTLVQKAR